MDYSVKKEAVFASQTVFEGAQECPVDLDFSLPDYCPDIQRILRCQVVPQVSSRSLAPGQLSVQGNVRVRLLYVDAQDGALRYCEHTGPFSLEFATKDVTERGNIHTQIKVDYVNFRAVSPRRLDIHGAFSVQAKVTARVQRDIVCDIEGAGLQQRKKDIEFSNVTAMGQQVFVLNETLEKVRSKPDVEAIVDSRVVCILTDAKPLMNKVMLTGQCLVKLLYISDLETGALDSMEYTAPISEIVEVDGMTEECKPNVDLCVLEHDVWVRDGAASGENLIEMEVKVAASAQGFEEKAVPVVSDAYSTEYEMEPRYDESNFTNLVRKINAAHLNRDTLDLSDLDLSKIIDVSSEVLSTVSTAANGEVLVSGELGVSIFALNTEDIPMYVEKTLNFEYVMQLSEEGEELFVREKANVTETNFRIVGPGNIEVSSEINVVVLLHDKKRFKSIVDVFIDEEHPKERDTSTSLTLYYADAGESLWDIARNYGTSVEAVQAENGTSQEAFDEAQMIMIPMG